jgi:hypothetical protein
MRIINCDKKGCTKIECIKMPLITPDKWTTIRLIASTGLNNTQSVADVEINYCPEHKLKLDYKAENTTFDNMLRDYIIEVLEETDYGR